MARVVIIDYGVGNLRSVEKACAAAGAVAVLSSDEQTLRAAERLVVPGVGAFRACMRALQASGFDQLVREQAREGTPILGICVGMQMLFDESDEFGRTPGLGLICGRVRHFPAGLPVPHVGWNRVELRRNDHPLVSGIKDESYFYFTHSYYCEAVDPGDVVGETEYGDTYPSVVARGGVCGVQFHPEKSQVAGLRLLRNFASEEFTG
jgi:imidazole glycerol-phosphate synthase subunit HisH